ncbi:competence protein ComK [Mesobacillus persicus]|uniref:Competence protein ComK n=1 Tax=Mesobacillus persicus TaxID=930146 RepID=A0A1H8D579_9BACI|nr:competence protein ComK [Mesobacillus persicus]SEN02470.1 competence protein ComK [Mesobacillus persicus]
MKFINRYIINQKTILVTGKYHSFGKLCTIVLEGETPILVDQSPIQVIRESLHYYGQNLQGAVEGAKSILGKAKMYPFIVCQAQDICLFPHISPTHPECIWFNHSHIIHTHAQGRETIIELSNSRTLEIKAKLTSFNTKKQKAGDLRRIVAERSNNSMIIHLEPKKEYKQCKDTGSIEFDEHPHECKQTLERKIADSQKRMVD